MTVDSVASGVDDVVGLRRRITELERIVAEYEQTTSYAPFFSHALDMLCIAGFDGYFKQVNPSWERVLGYPTAELLSKPFIDFVHPDDRDITIQETANLVSGEITVSFKNRYRCFDGSYKWLLWTAISVKELGLLYAIARDVTEQERTERQLRESEEMYRTMARNFPNGAIILYDRDLRYKLVDGLGLEALGFSKAELEGKTVWEVCTPDLLPTMEALLRGALEGQCGTFEYPFGGQWWIQYTVPLRNTNDEIVGGLIMAQNITERKQAEEAMRQAIIQEETIRAQAAALAELSTPLIPVNESTLVMPLIGAVDSRRVQQMMGTLLSGVAKSNATSVILDITGVPIVDTQVADVLFRAAQAVKLLGAQVILTGIRPEVAQTLVGLGIELHNLITRSRLQDGIAYALRNASK